MAGQWCIVMRGALSALCIPNPQNYPEIPRALPKLLDACETCPDISNEGIAIAKTAMQDLSVMG